MHRQELRLGLPEAPHWSLIDLRNDRLDASSSSLSTTSVAVETTMAVERVEALEEAATVKMVAAVEAVELAAVVDEATLTSESVETSNSAATCVENEPGVSSHFEADAGRSEDVVERFDASASPGGCSVTDRQTSVEGDSLLEQESVTEIAASATAAEASYASTVDESVTVSASMHGDKKSGKRHKHKKSGK